MCVKVAYHLVVFVLTILLLIVNGDYLNVVQVVREVLDVEALILDGTCADVSHNVEVKRLILIPFVEACARLSLVLGRVSYEIRPRSVIASCSLLIDDLLRTLAHSTSH